MMEDTTFIPFPKMARLSRRCVITEKIDGTNACVFIGEDGSVRAGSRTRWITPQDDNFGFAKWVEDNKDELLTLGAGRHFGEWWGHGIQRNYGLKERRFSLFNVQRWCLHGVDPKMIPNPNPTIQKAQDILPPCCGLVPILYDGLFSTEAVDVCIDNLREKGSQAVTGFIKPEGVVVFHIAAGIGLKKTIEKDEQHKGI